MVQDSFSAFLILTGRVVAGFIAALLLAFLGDITARVFNLVLGYPWPLPVYQAIHLIGVGAGAGVGAYLSWMALNLRWYLILGSAALALAGGIAGAYLGHVYGPGVDPTYWWSRFATDSTIYFSAAVVSIVVATTVGLITNARTKARLRAEFKPIRPSEVFLSRPPDSK